MISMPDQGATHGLRAPEPLTPMSGIWEIGNESASEAQLAILLAWAFHRGLIPLPQRKSIPIQVST